jgi:hypothetical protein
MPLTWPNYLGLATTLLAVVALILAALALSNAATNHQDLQTLQARL